MAPRGREGAPTYVSAPRTGTCAGKSCAEARLLIRRGEGLYSFEHFRLVGCSLLKLCQIVQMPFVEFSKMSPFREYVPLVSELPKSSGGC